jgi:coenzyme F420-dependent glucose-6-phosphate dehydrogenase
VQISYHVSHEQFSPRELFDLVKAAEKAGFDAAFTSDHINPWTTAQGHSGMIWAWLGAALAATQRLSFAGITIPTGFRYHPALVAQALGTLGEMYPGRLPWFAFGSGEAINESVVGRGWPEPAERNALLEDGARIVRDLLDGHVVTSTGRLPVDKARLWNRPPTRLAIVGAGLRASTAEWIGTWAEGLLTVGTDLQKLADNIAAFRRTNASAPIHVKVDLSWAPTEEQAMRQAHDQWRVQALGPKALQSLATPAAFDAAARAIPLERTREVVLISADLQQHARWLAERAALGVASLDLHNVGLNQGEFIEAFGAHVLPALRKAGVESG